MSLSRTICVSDCQTLLNLTDHGSTDAKATVKFQSVSKNQISLLDIKVGRIIEYWKGPDGVKSQRQTVSLEIENSGPS